MIATYPGRAQSKMTHKSVDLPLIALPFMSSGGENSNGVKWNRVILVHFIYAVLVHLLLMSFFFCLF